MLGGVRSGMGFCMPIAHACWQLWCLNEAKDKLSLNPEPQTISGSFLMFDYCFRWKPLKMPVSCPNTTSCDWKLSQEMHDVKTHRFGCFLRRTSMKHEFADSVGKPCFLRSSFKRNKFQFEICTFGISYCLKASFRNLCFASDAKQL